MEDNRRYKNMAIVLFIMMVLTMVLSFGYMRFGNKDMAMVQSNSNIVSNIISENQSNVIREIPSKKASYMENVQMKTSRVKGVETVVVLVVILTLLSAYQTRKEERTHEYTK